MDPIPSPYQISMNPNHQVTDHINRLRSAIWNYNLAFPSQSLSTPYQSHCLIKTLPDIVPWSGVKAKYNDLTINGFPNYEKYLYVGTTNSFWYPTFEDIAAELTALEVNQMVYLSDEESVNENNEEEGNDGNGNGSDDDDGSAESTISEYIPNSDEDED